MKPIAIIRAKQSLRRLFSLRKAPIFLVAALWLISAQAENIAMTVNNVPVDKAQLEQLVNNFIAQGAKDGDDLRKHLADELATREAVAQDAAKLGLDKKLEVQAALANNRRDILVNAWQMDYAAKHPVNEEEIQALYAKQKEDAGSYQYRVRHVLVNTEDDAKGVLVAIKKGKKMEDVARSRTLDSGSKATGGDIGWQVPALLVPPVRDAIKSLPKGQLSEPVQSQFGWHILRVEETKAFEFPAYDKVKPTLLQQLQTQANMKAIAELRKTANVE